MEVQAFLPGEMDRVTTCSWTSPQTHCVLEVQEEGSKSSCDSERAPLQKLFSELEESGITDYTLNGHELVHPSMAESGQGTPRARNGESETLCMLHGLFAGLSGRLAAHSHHPEAYSLVFPAQSRLEQLQVHQRCVGVWGGRLLADALAWATFVMWTIAGA